ncbi:hypothetical protein ACERII_05460 [Evansella sp. AB-rgal1]|uniref:hypothetical protein n=1 Tax=Evansella sp. AB-rgal1 TaxID=3242696 RepID=UPI00359E5446
MKISPRQIGDQHVKSVCEVLRHQLKNEPVPTFPATVTKTVSYIKNLFPNIISVNSKFESENTNHAKDITLYLSNNEVISVNLFLIKKGGRIQPKNPGAKSFFLKYFYSHYLQNEFNNFLEEEYKYFLHRVLNEKLASHYINEKKELKRLVSIHFPKFDESINRHREEFLYKLREKCFTLLKDGFNNKSNGFFNAYNIFFMTEDINIVTMYGKTHNDVTVNEFDPGTPAFSDIHIYKIGKNSVGIKYGKVALTLRFKFESGPTSSIKLAAGYDTFLEDAKRVDVNHSTLGKFEDILNNHNYISTSNNSNAIGKCHEAISYYHLLKEFPFTSQVDPNEAPELLKKYYSFVKTEVIQKLFAATATVVDVIKDNFVEKYNNFKIDSIELVPDSYINDRLDTGDLQIILIVKDNYIVEKISLKALSRKGSKITTKNPGIGTILSSRYFNIGNMDTFVNEVKTKYETGEFTRSESLEYISSELGFHLSSARQEQLKKGIQNLLGEATTIVTFYNDNVSYYKEHTQIESEVKVYVNEPTRIQNTLAWDGDSEKINLRVKFSKGQSHGWSSVKLTSEYLLKEK